MSYTYLSPQNPQRRQANVDGQGIMRSYQIKEILTIGSKHSLTAFHYLFVTYKTIQLKSDISWVRYSLIKYFHLFGNCMMQIILYYHTF